MPGFSPQPLCTTHHAAVHTALTRRAARRWGRQKARLFTVYLRALPPAERAGFTPRLAHALSEYHWVAPSEGGAMPSLHPLVAQLLAQHAGELLTAFS